MNIPPRPAGNVPMEAILFARQLQVLIYRPGTGNKHTHLSGEDKGAQVSGYTDCRKEVSC